MNLSNEKTNDTGFAVVGFFGGSGTENTDRRRHDAQLFGVYSRQSWRETAAAHQLSRHESGCCLPKGHAQNRDRGRHRQVCRRISQRYRQGMGHQRAARHQLHPRAHRRDGGALSHQPQSGVSLRILDGRHADLSCHEPDRRQDSCLCAHQRLSHLWCVISEQQTHSHHPHTRYGRRCGGVRQGAECARRVDSTRRMCRDTCHGEVVSWCATHHEAHLEKQHDGHRGGADGDGRQRALDFQ